MHVAKYNWTYEIPGNVQLRCAVPVGMNLILAGQGGQLACNPQTALHGTGFQEALELAGKQMESPERTLCNLMIYVHDICFSVSSCHCHPTTYPHFDLSLGRKARLSWPLATPHDLSGPLSCTWWHPLRGHVLYWWHPLHVGCAEHIPGCHGDTPWILRDIYIYIYTYIHFWNSKITNPQLFWRPTF